MYIRTNKVIVIISAKPVPNPLNPSSMFIAFDAHVIPKGIKNKIAYPKSISPKMLRRSNNYYLRRMAQSELNLPLFPTTTIGSFPQTSEVRKYRLKFKKKEINAKKYESFLKNETKKAIKFQENIGIDVIVHGEFERNDMVEYFGEQLQGFIFTKFGMLVTKFSYTGISPI